MHFWNPQDHTGATRLRSAMAKHRSRLPFMLELPILSSSRAGVLQSGSLLLLLVGLKPALLPSNLHVLSALGPPARSQAATGPCRGNSGNKPRGTLTSHFYNKWHVFNIKSAGVSMGNHCFQCFFTFWGILGLWAQYPIFLEEPTILT